MLEVTQNIDPDPYQGGSALIVPFAPVKPIKLTTTFLQAADIDAFLALQEKIRPTLTKPYHLKVRGEDDLKRHFWERMPAIGVKKEDGSLAAFGLVTFLKNEDAVRNLAGYPIKEWQKATTAVAQTVCVDPSLKGRGLSRSILDQVFSSAAQNGMTQIISAIADDNDASIAAFESCGYEPFHHGKDPVKGYDKTYFRRTI